MQILNIVLLVLSVILGVTGMILIWKPRPLYTLAYPEKNVKKASFVAFFFMFTLGTCFYFLLACLRIDQLLGILIYLIFILIPLTTYMNWYYSVISKETKRKILWKSYLSGFIGGLIGIFLPHYPSLCFVVIPGVTIYAIYWIVKLFKLGYKNYLFYYVFYWFTGFFLSAIGFATDYYNNARRITIEHERFGSLEVVSNPEILYIIISVLVFLMFISILLFVLDVKEYSPMYEKQYIEENKPREIGNLGVNSGNAV